MFTLQNKRIKAQIKNKTSYLVLQNMYYQYSQRSCLDQINLSLIFIFSSVTFRFCFFLKINYLNKENKIKGHELEVKSQECEQLEKDIEQAQSMLQQGTSRIHELEEIQAQQQEQVK